MIGIYKITSPKNRVYIGQSRNIKYRFNNYKNLRCNQQPRLYSSLLKHGVENHKFEVIEECSFELLNERERYWQDYYDVLSKRGLNCSLINTNEKPYVFSNESMDKMKSWERPKGEKHFLFGKKRPEHSLKMKGENHPMFGKKNIKLSEFNKKTKVGNKNMLGYKFSEESRKKWKEKNSGVKHRMYGKKHSKETIEKMKINHARARSIIVINIENGIFYESIKEASCIYKINISTLQAKLYGRIKNNTPLVLADIENKRYRTLLAEYYENQFKPKSYDIKVFKQQKKKKKF